MKELKEKVLVVDSKGRLIEKKEQKPKKKVVPVIKGTRK
jgi:hypothetical protein